MPRAATRVNNHARRQRHSGLQRRRFHQCPILQTEVCRYRPERRLSSRCCTCLARTPTRVEPCRARPPLRVQTSQGTHAHAPASPPRLGCVMTTLPVCIVAACPFFWLSAPAAPYACQDSDNHRIRKIDLPSGMTTTFPGSSTGFNNGIGTSAQFFYPMGVAIDPEGDFAYVGVRACPAPPRCALPRHTL